MKNICIVVPSANFGVSFLYLQKSREAAISAAISGRRADRIRRQSMYYHMPTATCAQSNQREGGGKKTLRRLRGAIILMDASRAPIPAPGMVMSRYHCIPGPCILPVQSWGSPEERHREEAISLSPRAASLRHPFSPSRVSLFVSCGSSRSLPPSPESSRTRNSRSANSHLKRTTVFTLSIVARTRRQVTR